MAGSVILNASRGATFSLRVEVTPQVDPHFTAGATFCLPDQQQCLAWSDSEICNRTRTHPLDRAGIHRGNVLGYFDSANGRHSAEVVMSAGGTPVRRTLNNGARAVDSIRITINVT